MSTNVVCLLKLQESTKFLTIVVDTVTNTMAQENLLQVSHDPSHVQDTILCVQEARSNERLQRHAVDERYNGRHALCKVIDAPTTSQEKGVLCRIKAETLEPCDDRQISK